MRISSQENFDGFRVEAGKPLTKNLQATHSLNLGTALSETPYSYQYGPVFQSDDEKTILIGKMGLDGVVTARIIKKILGNSVDLK